MLSTVSNIIRTTQTVYYILLIQYTHIFTDQHREKENTPQNRKNMKY